VDDVGSAYLNGNLLTSALTQFGNATFSTDDASLFREGENEFIISDINSGGGPSGVLFFAFITFNTVATVDLPVKTQCQVSQDPYDHPFNPDPDNTLRQSGCALTALSMALEYASQVFKVAAPPDTPSSLNRFLVEECGTDSQNLSRCAFVYAPNDPMVDGNLQLSSATAIVAQGRGPYEFIDVHETFDTDISTSAASAKLDSILFGKEPGTRGTKLPVIVQVQGSHGPRGHYIIVRGKNARGEYLTINPRSCVAPNGVLGNSFRVRGYVTDPPDDLSSLHLDVNAPSLLAVLDASGNKTGFDVGTKSLVNGIPGSAHATDQIDDDSGGNRHISPVHTIQLLQPLTGSYTIQVYGTKDGFYSLNVKPRSHDGSIQRGFSIAGITAPGLATRYVFDYSPLPGSSLSLTGQFDGGGTTPADVNKLLTYSDPVAAVTVLPRETTKFPLQLIYSTSIQPRTFKARLNGEDISRLFHPAPGTGEVVNLPLEDGRNVLRLSIQGAGTGRSRDRDRLVFIVPEEKDDHGRSHRWDRRGDESGGKDEDD
jgi:hypothetical protein